MKTKYEVFLQWNTKFFLLKVLGLLFFGSCQNCRSFASLVAEICRKLCNKKVLRSGEPCTCEYVTLLQSFHRSTLSIHWYTAQNSCNLFNFEKEVFYMSNLYKNQIWSEMDGNFFFLSGFSFTTIHESQDCRGRGRAFL